MYQSRVLTGIGKRSFSMPGVEIRAKAMYGGDIKLQGLMLKRPMLKDLQDVKALLTDVASASGG